MRTRPGTSTPIAPAPAASAVACGLALALWGAACGDASASGGASSHPDPAASSQAPGPAADEPWFGLPLPPGLTPGVPEVIAGPRPPAPAAVPAGEPTGPDLDGEAIRRDLETIVGFSRESRRGREIGDGGLWGRISGFPSGRSTVEWAVERLREAGVQRVELQPLEQEEGEAMWLPLSWEVRLLGDPAFGEGSGDVVLESAMPLTGTELPAGLTAPLVHVGTASPAELARLDMEGKVAVQKVVPQGHTVFARRPTGPRAEELLARGAVAVLNVVDLPGNMRSRDMGCGGGPCFNLGGRDGRFLESVLGAAAEAGVQDRVRARLRARGRSFTGLSAVNGVAVVPGERSDENIVINAHADGWFEGAGDNGDGLAVMLALARHFARPANAPGRTLVFVASAGHHTAGLHGPRSFIATNPDLVRSTVLTVNLEHTAQREITPARSEHEDGYRRWVTGSYEAPIVAGVTNGAPFLEELVERGIRRYGTNFVSGPSSMASGEGGAYRRRLDAPVFTAMQGSPLYHTTGEVLEMVSAPGLERMARFMAFCVREVADAPADRIDPR